MLSRFLAFSWLSSPALPTGSFAFSGGLEAAVAAGEVHDAPSLTDYLLCVLQEGLGNWELPVLYRCTAAAVYRDLTVLQDYDARIKASRESAELLQEEQSLGKALLRLLRGLDLLPPDIAALDLGYVAAYGTAAALLRGEHILQQEESCELLQSFALGYLTNAVTAASKLVPLGQTASQQALQPLLLQVPLTAERALSLPEEELGQSLMGLSFNSMVHEEQYSRLFRS